MEVCSSCGIVAPRPGLPCEGCGLSATVRAPERRGALYFVQAQAQFQCRGCGRLAPLDAVALDGLAWCASCGLTQAVDPSGWPEALAFAHAVGDLAGGEGLHPNAYWSIELQNPHGDIGIERAMEMLTLAENRQVNGLEVRRSLRLRAAPGHPLCGACKGLLHVEILSPGRARTRCDGCGRITAFDVSAGVLSASRGLRGILADAQRADLKEARAADQGGIVALSCPGCGAPLSVDGLHAQTANCAFCHLVCRLPSAPTRGAGAVEVPPTPFWLLFGGPSARRAQLESGGGPGAPTPLAIAPPPAAERAGGLRGLLGLVPTAIVAGAMTVVTGVALFLLLRMGMMSGM